MKKCFIAFGFLVAAALSVAIRTGAQVSYPLAFAAPWLTYNATPTCGSGAIGGGVSASVFYSQSGKSTLMTFILNDSTNGTCAGTITLSGLPFASLNYSAFGCREYTTGVAGQAWMSFGASAINIAKYDGTTLAATSNFIVCSGVVQTS